MSLSTTDILTLFRRIFRFCRGDEKFTIKTFWKRAILGRDLEEHVDLSEPLYAGVPPEEVEEHIPLSPVRESSDLREAYNGRTAQWANNVHQPPPPHNEFERHHYRHQSTMSEGTLYGNSSSMRSFDKLQQTREDSTPSLTRRLYGICYAVLERFLVFAGLTQLLTGIVTYTGTSLATRHITDIHAHTGGCRGTYENGCLAHLISSFLLVSSLANFLTQYGRGRYILVIWPILFRPFSWDMFRIGLGLESGAESKRCIWRIRRMFCYFLLRRHQHVDGEIRCKSW